MPPVVTFAYVTGWRISDPLESFAMTEEEHKPKLATLLMVALIQCARLGIALTGVATRSERSWRKRVRACVCSCQPELSVA